MRSILLILLFTSTLTAQHIGIGNTSLNKGAKGDKGDMPTFSINGTTVNDGDNINVSGQSGVKYVTAAEAGLTTEVLTVSSPFTNTQYTNAYNNAINIATEVQTAFNEGYSGIIFERGVYHIPANSLANTGNSGTGGYCIRINDVHDFEIDFNGSTLFIIYDSLNRSPYDITTNNIYDLTFKMINITSSTGLTIKNLELRGDNYMRSWVSGEELDIGCYGIVQSVGTHNLKLENYEGHGFRCEPLAIDYGGYSNVSLPTWESGGIDNSGVLQIESGAYTTPFIELSSLSVIDNNSVSLVGTGYTREIPFRSSVFKVSYYESDNTFITSDNSVQNKLNYLPTDCAKIKLTAYNDERTDATVDYGSCAITSGTPRGLEVTRSKFYNNMRGGISGAANNMILSDCVFHTIGLKTTEKYGWLTYSDPTRFAIDIEDGMPDFIKIVGCRFEDTDHAVLIPACQTLIFNNNLCQQNAYSSGMDNAKYLEMSGNIFKSDGLRVTFDGTFNEHSAKITNNDFLKSVYVAEATDSDKNIIISSNNTFNNTRVTEIGNVISTGNYHSNFNQPFETAITTSDVIKFDNIIETKAGFTSWVNYSLSTRHDNSNTVFTVEGSANRFNIDSEKIPSINFKGATANATLNTIWNRSVVYEQTFTGTKFNDLLLVYGDGNTGDNLANYTVNYKDVEINNTTINLLRRANVDAGIMTLNFDNCMIDLTDVTETEFINNAYSNIGGSVVMNFTDCLFTSKTSKTINLYGGVAIVGLTATLTNCEKRRVTLNGTYTEN